jgi:hypothetical protein
MEDDATKMRKETIKSGLRRDRATALRAVAVTVAMGASVMGLAAPRMTFAATAAGCSEQAQTAAGFRSSLPDCRAYEMVSPASKNGANAGFISAQPLIQASEDGTAITYYVDNPIVDNAKGNPEEDRVLSTSDAGVWSSQDISTAHSLQSGGGAPNEYLAFSTDLSRAVVEPEAYPARQLDVRDSGTGAYEPVAIPEGAEPTKPEFLAASADLKSIVFHPSTYELQHKGEEPTGARTLYLSREGRRQLVSILPDGEPYGGYVGGEARASDSYSTSVGLVSRNDVSSAGTRVIWEAILPSHVHTIHLYVRDLESEQTVQADAPQGVSEEEIEGSVGHPSLGAAFQTASASGNEVFFTDSKRLKPGAQPGDLYVFSVASGQLTDLTPGVGGEAANVQGVVPGASEDGSYVYFVAAGVLGTAPNARGERAVAGKDNLYVAHDDGAAWSTTYIATLSSGDAPDWDGSREIAGSPGLSSLTSRVSPNGRYLAFMSDRPLTGYDTVVASAQTPAEEVYEYDAMTNTLACASCNPRLPQPQGIYDTGNNLHAEFQGNWAHRWIAASVPGWTGSSGNPLIVPHQSRYLSDSGRLFFDSPEALVAQDTNGVEDVYEYEPDGVGNCASNSNTGSVAAYGGGGCLGLISGGTGSEESEFVDASETADDVFFDTSQPLVAEDQDANADIYDAHVCSVNAPCPLAPAEAPSPCASGEGCRPGTVTAAVFGAPSSAAVAGAGNLAPPGSKPAVKFKPLTRAQKLTSALKACRRDRAKKKRGVCEKKARREYGRRK